MKKRNICLISKRLLLLSSIVFVINQSSLAAAAESELTSVTGLVNIQITHGQPSQMAYARVKRLVMGMQSQFRVIALYRFSEQDQQAFHTQRIDVYDGQGALGHSRDYEFKPDQSSYYAYADLSLNPDTHQPGDWQIEVYLDNQLMGSEYLQVLAGRTELAATPADEPLIVGQPILRKQYFAEYASYTATVTMHVDRDGKVLEVASDEAGSRNPTIFDILAREAVSMFVFPPDGSGPAQGEEYEQIFDFVLQDAYSE